MDWGKSRRSDNVVEDSGGGSYGGGGGRRFSGGGRIGLGGIVLVIIVSLLLGKNPLEVLSVLSGGADTQTASQSDNPAPAPAGNDPQTDFVRAILGSTEDVWTDVFQKAGSRYTAPRMVLFHNGVRTACGAAESAVGPFYCAGDRQVYLDTGFFQEMDTQLKASGDFARAYVIAHEVGHHVQNLLGTFEQVGQAQRRGAAVEGADGLSVRQELQADCYAGVWANVAQQRLQWLQAGDVESGMNAASAVGDDRLQKQARGYVVPDSFTHGTSAQRVRWFRAGFDSGNIAQCDTFRARML